MTKVTIRDVAAAAGVSAATVSRALSQPGRVTLETAQRVRRVADELGYRARAVAVDPLDVGLVGEIGALVPVLRYPIFADYLHGVQGRCDARDFSLSISATRDSGDVERGLLDRMLRRVDGLILFSPRVSDVTIRRAAGVRPVVVVNRLVRGVRSVIADDRASIDAMVRELVRLGHRSVAYVPGAASSWQNGLRWQGLLTACQREGVRLRRLECPYVSGRAGTDAAPLIDGTVVDRFLERPATALVAFNDALACGCMTAFAARGVRVPDDVSVIGFDDTQEGRMGAPRLATVGVDRERMGELAATRLIERVLHVGDAGDAPVVQESVFMPAASLGPAPVASRP